MGVKCSLIGHNYGEPATEEDREERGSEVVIVTREVETCGRCGHQRVVSENKEVTSLEPPEPQPAEYSTGSDLDEDFEPPESAEEDDGIILEDDEPGRAPGEWPDEAEERQAAGGPAAEAAATGAGADAGPGAGEPAADAAEGAADATADEGSGDDEADRAAAGASIGATVPEGEYRCPACGFTTPVEASSLREGDICPRCREGYLDHVS